MTATYVEEEINIKEAPAPEQEFDQAQAEAFAEKILGVMNGAALALMTSIGHRTGLFDTLASLPPVTSEQLATAAGLNERYVREWLGAMVTGEIVKYESADGTYSLPAEHAAWLTRAASPNNLAVAMQFIPLLAAVEEQIIESFRQGGGVPYAAYPRFHEVMAEESAQTVVAALIDAILPLVPGLTADLRASIDVLDIGCGSGRALILLAATFPNSRFTGYDFSAEAIARATAAAEEKGLTNIRFAVKDATTLGEISRYDLVTAFDAIHDQIAPAQVLAGIAQALRPGGTFLMQDIRASSHVHRNIDNPVAPFLYTISCLHCMTVSLSAGGDGLGACWGEEKALEMLAAAGLPDAEVKQLPHDIMNNYYIVRKP